MESLSTSLAICCSIGPWSYFLLSNFWNTYCRGYIARWRQDDAQSLHGISLMMGWCQVCSKLVMLNRNDLFLAVLSERLFTLRPRALRAGKYCFPYFWFSPQADWACTLTRSSVWLWGSSSRCINAVIVLKNTHSYSLLFVLSVLVAQFIPLPPPCSTAK